MTWFLCTVAHDSPRNWDLCKEISAWGVATQPGKFRQERVQVGDKLLIWLAKRGYVSCATVCGDVRIPASKAEVPWPGGLHRYGAVIPFRIDLELDPPLMLRFHSQKQELTGINVYQLRRGFVAVNDAAGEAAVGAMQEALRARADDQLG